MKRIPELEELITDVEQLLATLRDDASPQVRALRTQLAALKNASVAAAAESVAEAGLFDHAASAARRIRRYAGDFDDYITGYPRLGFLTGLLVGGTVVYLAGLVAADDT